MKVLCMSFDGDSQIERPEFETRDEAWSYAGDLGSKWFFYPFVFLVTDSELTIVDAPDNLEFFKGKRVRTVEKIFETFYNLTKDQKMNAEEFSYQLAEAYCQECNLVHLETTDLHLEG